MKIYSVTDAAFRPYGKILEGYDTAPLCAAMRSIPMPEQGTAYEPSITYWRNVRCTACCKITPMEGCPYSWACAGATTQG